jgi:hypothetical protein
MCEKETTLGGTDNGGLLGGLGDLGDVSDVLFLDAAMFLSLGRTALTSPALVGGWRRRQRRVTQC